jgi:hypothetical protein
MISLIYISTAVQILSNDELLDILRVSYKNNGVNSVTGMLLYQGGNFMQVLEGSEEGVMEIFGKIKKDTRHSDINLISIDPIEERQFEDWKMAFVNLDAEAAKKESAFSEFLEDGFSVDKYRQTPQLAYIMLLSFKEHLR